MRRFPICIAGGREDRVRMAQEGGSAENGCSVNQGLYPVYGAASTYPAEWPYDLRVREFPHKTDGPLTGGKADNTSPVECRP